MTGALSDYLAHAASSLKNSDIRFETVPYPTTEAALEALKKGEIDCVFPVNLSSYDADQLGVRLTNPVMKTEMHAVMRTSKHHHLSRDSSFTFVINQGNANIETFIKDFYPEVEVGTPLIMFYEPEESDKILEEQARKEDAARQAEAARKAAEEAERQRQEQEAAENPDNPNPENPENPNPEPQPEQPPEQPPETPPENPEG